MNDECRMMNGIPHSAFRILHSAFLYLVYNINSFALQNLKCFFDKSFDGGIGHLFQQFV